MLIQSMEKFDKITGIKGIRNIPLLGIIKE